MPPEGAMTRGREEASVGVTILDVDSVAEPLGDSEVCVMMDWGSQSLRGTDVEVADTRGVVGVGGVVGVADAPGGLVVSVDGAGVTEGCCVSVGVTSVAWTLV